MTQPQPNVSVTGSLTNLTHRELGEASTPYFMGYYLDMWMLPHRVEMIDHIEADHQYILLLYPRDHWKTTTVTGWLVKKLAYNTALRVLCVSNTKELALQNVKKIRDRFMYNTKIFRDFGDLQGEPWGTEKFTLKRPPSPAKEPSCIARSLGASALGMHFDVIWCDDIVTTLNQWTEDQRKKVWEWFATTLVPCLDRQGKLIVTGTRKHIEDIYYRLLTTKTWVSHVYRAIIDEATQEVLAPWAYNYARLVERRITVGDLEFEQEYQNEPVARKGLGLKLAWVKYYDPDNPPKFSYYYMGVDPAVGKSDVADYTAIVLIGVTHRLHYYVLDIQRHHWGETAATWAKKIEEAFLYYASSNRRPSVVGVESAYAQKFQARELMQLASSMPLKFVEYRTLSFEGQQAKDKVARLQAMGLFFEQGRVYLPDPDKEPMTAKFLHDEYLQFPEGEHDDMLDALAIALIVSPLTSAGPSFRSG